MRGPIVPACGRGRWVISRVVYFRCDEHLVRGEWVFHPARPLEVELRLDTGRGVVSWVFARQLLADAYSGAGTVGEGDVRVRVGGGWLWLHLAPPGGECELWCWDDAVESFLWATYTLGVPRCPGCDAAGCESCAEVADRLDAALGGLGLNPGWRSGAPERDAKVGTWGGGL